ncbi:MAG: IS701 family transposase [Planctomycetaceae bacterium]|nr:IS701 family transposase [Planctomycetaceae bacterium]
MNKTYTPELTPDVLERLHQYAQIFHHDFGHKRQATYNGIYLQGLLHDGERKSIEPLSRRVTLPPDLTIKATDQALQQFVNQSPWDEQKLGTRYRKRLAKTFASPKGIFLIDDSGFPKQGKHSVGVQHQYCGALGKKANCQVAVSLHYVSPKGHYPLAMRLYLPEVWLKDKKRLDQVGVPEEFRQVRTKPQIALELLDQVRQEGLPGRVVVTDAGYGVSQDLRDGLAQRELFYLAGVTGEMVVFTAEPQWIAPPAATGGRPQKRPRLAAGSPRPVSLKELAARTPLWKVTWREGTKGKLSAQFAWLRVWPGQGWSDGDCAFADPIWLLIEKQADGKLKYAFSNLPASTSRLRAVRLWKSRWAVEQGYQQMKEELALDHFEGRSWRGFHHHAYLVMLAYGFLVLEQLREKEHPAKPGKKGVKRRGSPYRRSVERCRSC